MSAAPDGRAPRVIRSRGVASGILFGALLGLGGGPITIAAIAVVSLIAGRPDALFWLVAALPSVLVGAIVGAAVGGVATSSAAAALALTARSPGRSANARRAAASVGSALGAGVTIVVALLVCAAMLPSAPAEFVWVSVVLTACVTAVAAGIGWNGDRGGASVTP